MAVNNADAERRINFQAMKLNFNQSRFLPMSPEDFVVQVARARLRALSRRFDHAFK